MPPPPTPVSRLQGLWRTLSPLPGGVWLFSRVFGWMVPYSGSIRPRITALAPGHARVELVEGRRVRNHLRSVHAVALANLGEAASGLAMVGALPATVRGILVALEVTYTKKARGRLVADCRCAIPEVTESQEHDVHVHVVDEAGDIVASVTARWLLGLVPTGKTP